MCESGACTGCTGSNTRPVGRPSGRHVGLLCPECESPTYKGCRNNCVDLSARNRNIANKTPAPQREAGANTRPVGRPSGRHVGLLCPECESPTYKGCRNNCVDLSARNRNIANKTPAPQGEAGANTRPVGRPSGRHVGLLCPEGRSPTYKGCRNNCVDLSARNRNIANKTPASQREAGANTRPVGRPSGRHIGLKSDLQGLQKQLRRFISS